MPPGIISSLEVIQTHQGRELTGPQLVSDYKTLTSVHSRLATIVAPAKPGTILMMDTERSRPSFWSFLGPVRLVRRMILVAVISLFALIGSATSPLVNSQEALVSIFECSGYELLINLLFLLAAAGVGASFSILFKVYGYVEDGTYDTRYDPTYYIRFVLGLIAGMLIAELLPAAMSTDISSPQFAKLSLAILGGFSSAAVHRILERLVFAMEATVQGDQKGDKAKQLQVMQAQMQGQLASGQLDAASKLSSVQSLAASGASAEEIASHVQNLMSGLGGADAEDIDPPAPVQASSDSGSGAPIGTPGTSGLADVATTIGDAAGALAGAVPVPTPQSTPTGPNDTADAPVTATIPETAADHDHIPGDEPFYPADATDNGAVGSGLAAPAFAVSAPVATAVDPEDHNHIPGDEPFHPADAAENNADGSGLVEPTAIATPIAATPADPEDHNHIPGDEPFHPADAAENGAEGSGLVDPLATNTNSAQAPQNGADASATPDTNSGLGAGQDTMQSQDDLVSKARSILGGNGSTGA